MKREIKFRAWDFNSRSWYVPTEYGVSEGAKEFFAVDKEIIKFKRGDMELMQFTGLLDKNGIEIYEGDIVERPDEGNAGLVRWFDGGYWGVEVESDVWSYMFDCNHPENHEVIGSIYENPELLD